MSITHTRHRHIRHYIDTGGTHYPFHKMTDDQIWRASRADSKVPPRHRSRRLDVFLAELERRGWPKDPDLTPERAQEIDGWILEYRRSGQLPPFLKA